MEYWVRHDQYNNKTDEPILDQQANVAVEAEKVDANELPPPRFPSNPIHANSCNPLRYLLHSRFMILACPCVRLRGTSSTAYIVLVFYLIPWIWIRLKMQRDNRVKVYLLCQQRSFVEKCDSLIQAVTAMDLTKLPRMGYWLRLVLVYPSVYSIEDMMTWISRVN
jgi:hypothetical protein